MWLGGRFDLWWAVYMVVLGGVGVLIECGGSPRASDVLIRALRRTVHVDGSAGGVGVGVGWRSFLCEP